MMLPMSIRCNTCAEYLYRGKKFNSRKETVTGEEYLGIKIFRFYIKCTRGSAELTIKTDPKNSDYQCEFGASRNFEPWRENSKIVEDAKGKREQEEQGDAMKALENRTTDSKVEMDILDALDEIRSLNARQSKMDPLEILMQRQSEIEEEEKRLNDEDESLIQAAFGSKVKRLEEDEGDAEGGESTEENAELINRKLLEKLELEPIFKTTKKIKVKEEDSKEKDTILQNIIKENKTKNSTFGGSNLGVKIKVMVEPKKEGGSNNNVTNSKTNNTTNNNNNSKVSTGLLNLLGTYADDDSDQDE